MAGAIAMSGRWKTVAKLKFRGKRFEGHALDIGALGELAQFQRLVEETAKTLWRDANPGRERSRLSERSEGSRARGDGAGLIRELAARLEVGEAVAAR
jgi:hypothetical protein